MTVMAAVGVCEDGSTHPCVIVQLGLDDHAHCSHMAPAHQGVLRSTACSGLAPCMLMSAVDDMHAAVHSSSSSSSSSPPPAPAPGPPSAARSCPAGSPAAAATPWWTARWTGPRRHPAGGWGTGTRQLSAGLLGTAWHAGCLARCCSQLWPAAAPASSLCCSWHLPSIHSPQHLTPPPPPRMQAF
jgi:hypothetical protein